MCRTPDTYTQHKVYYPALAAPRSKLCWYLLLTQRRRGPRENQISSSFVYCASLRNLACEFASPPSPLLHPIPLFHFSLSFLHSIFFAIKTRHLFDSDALASLCALPTFRRRDLAFDAASSPDFVQAPECLFT